MTDSELGILLTLLNAIAIIACGFAPVPVFVRFIAVAIGRASGLD